MHRVISYNQIVEDCPPDPSSLSRPIAAPKGLARKVFGSLRRLRSSRSLSALRNSTSETGLSLGASSQSPGSARSSSKLNSLSSWTHGQLGSVKSKLSIRLSPSKATLAQPPVHLPEGYCRTSSMHASMRSWFGGSPRKRGNMTEKMSTKPHLFEHRSTTMEPALPQTHVWTATNCLQQPPSTPISTRVPQQLRNMSELDVSEHDDAASSHSSECFLRDLKEKVLHDEASEISGLGYVADISPTPSIMAGWRMSLEVDAGSRHEETSTPTCMPAVELYNPNDSGSAILNSSNSFERSSVEQHDLESLKLHNCYQSNPRDNIASDCKSAVMNMPLQDISDSCTNAEHGATVRMVPGSPQALQLSPPLILGSNRALSPCPLQNASDYTPLSINNVTNMTNEERCLTLRENSVIHQNENHKTDKCQHDMSPKIRRRIPVYSSGFFAGPNYSMMNVKRRNLSSRSSVSTLSSSTQSGVTLSRVISVQHHNTYISHSRRKVADLSILSDPEDSQDTDSTPQTRGRSLTRKALGRDPPLSFKTHYDTDSSFESPLPQHFLSTATDRWSLDGSPEDTEASID